jgi:genome maintenance exonuclease 1
VTILLPENDLISQRKIFKHELYEFEELEAVMDESRGGRVYITPTGERYRSVTTLLGRLSKKSIMEWRKAVGEETANKISSQAARRGTNLHKICEDYVGNEPDYLKKKLPNVVSMFKDIQPLIDKHITAVHGIEIPLYSHKLQTAGRCDLFCSFDNVPTILDFKTSSKIKKKEWITSYFMQATCYAMMVYERKGIKIPQLAIMIAVENEEPQLFVEQTETYLTETYKFFQSCIE